MRQHIIETVVREGLADEFWATVCERARYRCEYCDKDLMKSPDAYLAWQADHIIPGGKTTLENIALSCATCNMRYKGTWNPTSCVDEDAERHLKIKAVQKHVLEQKRQWDEKLDEHRRAVRYPLAH